jgi:hypothetical protein
MHLRLLTLATVAALSTAALEFLGPGQRTVFEKLATVQLLDVVVPTTDGRELLLIRHTEPGRDVRLVPDRLGLTLPSQPPPRIRALQPV